MCKTIILIYDHFIEDMNSTTKKKKEKNKQMKYIYMSIVIRMAINSNRCTFKSLTLSWAATHYCSAVAIKNLTIIMFLESTTHCSEESHRKS